MRPLVAVPTFRRPDDLRTFLSSVIPQIYSGAHLLVVDNDADGSGRDVFDSVFVKLGASELAVSYVIEPQPGIARVRNRALRWLRDSEHDAVVFVDDDEHAADGWLSALLDYANHSEADIVSGPVISVLPENAPAWIRRGGFFQRAVQPTGSTNWTAASNNTLLRRTAWEEAGTPWFDPEFSRTGGSDTDFFSRMAESGATITYTAEAVVYEDVPQGRMTKKWLARRAYRSGIVNGIVLRRKRSRMTLIALGAATAGAGAAYCVSDFVTRQYPTARNWNRVRYGIGLATAQLGHRVFEYQRG